MWKTEDPSSQKRRHQIGHNSLWFGLYRNSLSTETRAVSHECSNVFTFVKYYPNIVQVVTYCVYFLSWNKLKNNLIFKISVAWLCYWPITVWMGRDMEERMRCCRKLVEKVLNSTWCLNACYYWQVTDQFSINNRLNTNVDRFSFTRI